jgi:hypothetical protein
MNIFSKFTKKISLSCKRDRQGADRVSEDRPSDSALQYVASLDDDAAKLNHQAANSSSPTSADTMNSFTIESTSRTASTQSTVLVNSTGQCPFKHGTVYAGPYPGYVHGNAERGICPHGCRPAKNYDITGGESLAETMLREAIEYLELYYHERSEDMSGTEGFLSKSERMAQVKKSIDETGTYVHTFDELG